MTQRSAITFRATAEVMAAVDAYAAKEFCKRGEAVAAILERAVTGPTGTASEPSKSAALKEMSAETDLAVKQLRLAQLRKTIITVDDALKVFEADLGAARTEGLALMADIAAEMHLDAEELKRRFLEAMAGPFELRREPYQKLAENFSKQSLPT